MPSGDDSGVRSPPLVAIVAYDGLATFEFGCAIEVFGLPRPEAGPGWYRHGVCSFDAAPLEALGGLTVEVPHGPELLEGADIVVLPGWRDPGESPSCEMLQSLRRAHARGVRIASICSGAFVLAWAGLLDGRRATTHWRLVERLARDFPAITVETNALYVDEGRLLTSAGSAAGLDMMLHMVRKDHGTRTANLVAQRLVVSPHREGGQPQWVPRPLPTARPGRVAQLMDWVRTNLALEHTVQSLAERASMSPRTLQRHFIVSTGLSPTDWIIRERVRAAREILENSGDSLQQIVERTGFGSLESFRRHFRLQTQASPTSYRRDFQRTQPGHRARPVSDISIPSRY